MLEHGLQRRVVGLHEARQGQITQAYKAVEPIKSNTSHPNDDVIQGDTKQAQIQRDMVKKVWEELYQAQRDDVLKWPADIGEEFVAYMQKRKFGDPISEEMRGFYNNYIENRFDSLLEIVKAKKMAARGGAGGRGGYGGMMGEGGFGAAAVADPAEDEDYLVDWLDQGQLQQKLMFPGGKPTALQVWVTQEDLWVYETLLKVIKQTNQAKGAVRPDNTAVRMIMELQVGAMAATESMGQIIIPQPDAAAGGMMGERGGYGGMMGEGGYGGMMGEGGYGGMMGEGGYGGMMGGEGGYGGMMGERGGYGGMMGEGGGGGGDATLLMRRYLNAEGKPEEAGSVDTVLASEFRQLPIKMRLMMDEKFIPTILLKCANATLPIEVKQVRINPSKSGGTFGSTNGARGNANIRGVDQAAMATLTEVIIRGAVYIYNEPDTARLTIPGEELAQPGDEVAQAGDGAVLN